MNLDAWLDYIANQHQQKTIDMGLSRTEEMVRRCVATAGTQGGYHRRNKW